MDTSTAAVRTESGITVTLTVRKDEHGEEYVEITGLGCNLRGEEPGIYYPVRNEFLPNEARFTVSQLPDGSEFRVDSSRGNDWELMTNHGDVCELMSQTGAKWDADGGIVPDEIRVAPGYLMEETGAIVSATTGEPASLTNRAALARACAASQERREMREAGTLPPLAEDHGIDGIFPTGVGAAPSPVTASSGAG